jgi:serine/threonine-protein kinase
LSEIGVGGMASVHLARKDGPGGFRKWVAIKRIHPHLVEEEAIVRMFLDEARIAARISHPNVATVFDLGKHEDAYWIAMEYLHGEPLREVMRRTEETGTKTPPEIACRVIADAALGLHAAHQLLGDRGEALHLVHRDVTPHNLFVTYDGTTKVVDFGIAKFSPRMSSTRAGTLKGKLAYMSPEQVSGRAVDRRTDVFALGVVLWELTTGRRLFRMESDLDTLKRVQECSIVRPSALVEGYPMDLEGVVMKALAKNREDRFETAGELSRTLQSLLMRRGLLTGSDEVTAYMRSIFRRRIHEREQQLRWAGGETEIVGKDPIQPLYPANGTRLATASTAADSRWGSLPSAFFVPFVAPFARPALPKVASPRRTEARGRLDPDEATTFLTVRENESSRQAEDTVVTVSLADDPVPSRRIAGPPPLPHPFQLGLGRALHESSPPPKEAPGVGLSGIERDRREKRTGLRYPLWAVLLAGVAVVVLGRILAHFPLSAPPPTVAVPNAPSSSPPGSALPQGPTGSSRRPGPL